MHNEPSGVNDPPVPWTGTELLLAVLLGFFLWGFVAAQVFLVSGFFRWLYGRDAVALVLSSPGQEQRGRAAAGAAAGVSTEVAWPAARQLVLYRMNLWVSALAYPFQTATFPLLFAVFSRTRPAQLGLTARHFRRNLLLGGLAALVLLPLVLGLNYLAVLVYSHWVPSGTQEHPLTLLAHQSLLPVEWLLLVLTAVVAAPLFEELVFRGVLLPWLAQRSWGGHLALTLAVVYALLQRHDRILDAWELPWPLRRWAFLDACAPALFIVTLLPFYWLVCRLPSSPVRASISPPSEDGEPPPLPTDLRLPDDSAFRLPGPYPEPEPFPPPVMESAPAPPRRTFTFGRALFGTSALFASAHAAIWPTPVALFVLALGLGYLARRTGSLVGPIMVHGLLNGLSCALLFWGLD